MKLNRNITFVLMSVLAFAANAKIASWDISPKYEKLDRYYNDMYVFQQNGKWGLAKGGNKEILPASCDFITPFTDGYALAGTKEGNNYALQYLIDEEGNVITPKGKYYLPRSNQYVSEGKLVVMDRSGKYGYITPDGATIIRCQFDDALPFKEGWAPVRQGNYTKYVTENYDRNPSRSILPVDFHYGEMTMSSCFHNGRAAVAYNTDFAFIDDSGRKINKLSKNEFLDLYKKYNAAPKSSDVGFKETSTYSVFTQNGKSGLKQGESVLVSPQFESFPKQYSDGAILATMNGKYGLLNIVDGEVTASVSSRELEVDRKGNIPAVTVSYSFPASVRNPKVMMDLGDGTYQDMSARLSRNGNQATLSVTPIVAKNAEQCSIRGIVSNNGITLANIEKTFTVSYPIRLRVSAPGPSYIKASENDYATFSSTIFNDSNKPVTVTAIWSTGRKTSVTIAAHGSKGVSDAIYVGSRFEKHIGITLSTGESNGTTITFDPYF